MTMPTEEQMVNDVMYDVNNPREPVEYEADVPTLVCGKCKRRNIKETASKSRNAADLI